MCGIAILANYNGDASEALECVKNMTYSLRHRGPDSRGYIVRGQVGIGHTRLSIVGSDSSAQPMVTEDDRYAITFNGEIYNYKELKRVLEDKGHIFKTMSDTEVVLLGYRQYGCDIVSKIEGMFSFIIHDLERNELFAARDPLGIKPFFYFYKGMEFLAASEIKAIFASGIVQPELNLSSIRAFFNWQFCLPGKTAFLNIQELPAGHYLKMKIGESPKIFQFWDFEFPKEGEYEERPDSFWIDEFGSALCRSVKSHAIGDSDIATYLSGGIDSSTIAWLMSDLLESKTKTFSVHFPDSPLDESGSYRKIAKHLKLDNTQIILDNKRGDYFEELIKSTYHLEQPQRMALDVPYLLMSGAVKSEGYKVVYTGDGADEILGGYDCYRRDYLRLIGNSVRDINLRRMLYFDQFSKDLPKSYVKLIFDLHSPRKQLQTKNRFGFYPVWYDFWNVTTKILPSLFSDEFNSQNDFMCELDNAASLVKEKVKGLHRINASLYLEGKTRLPGWILWRTDRMSMANGVEARVPFLDLRLVELCCRLPPSMKLKGMNEKYILKRYAMKHLPKLPSKYKKKAFYTPIREWFFEEKHAEALEHFIGDSALLNRGLFKPEAVHKICRILRNAHPRNDSETEYQIMQYEWILMLVLTTQILQDTFL